MSAEKRSLDEEELTCSICIELVVDAVQISCCGSLYCRACICKCTCCPLCRKSFEIIPDVRCERLSAATLRKCTWCSFRGNRASVSQHEARECDLIPASILRNKIEELVESCQHHHIKQRELMRCALGPEPAVQAMRFLHKVVADNGVFVIDRAAARGNVHWVCSWFGEAYKHALSPREFVDSEMFRRILQVGEDATNHRCFSCGTMGHWAHDCTLNKGKDFGIAINEQLFNAGCCSNCGIPVSAQLKPRPIEPEIAGLQVS